LYETFTERPTNSENLRVAVGNAELSNKMALCTTNKKMFFIKTFYCSGGSCAAVERQYPQEFSIRTAQSRDIICRTVKQFEET
jgi:hypothetical protein